MTSRVNRWLFYIWMTAFLTPACSLYSQIHLQLERSNTLWTKKFYYGDDIHFKTRVLPLEWQRGEILQILPEDRAIVFVDRITYLDDITEFKYYRSWPRASGFILTRFGVGWLAFGGIIEGGRAAGVLDTQYKFGWDTAAIGIGSFVTGYLIHKLWAVSRRKINDRHRLRIIDLRIE